MKESSKQIENRNHKPSRVLESNEIEELTSTSKKLVTCLDASELVAGEPKCFVLNGKQNESKEDEGNN